MRSILAFGDSNTWGLIPGSKDRERYSRNVRWTAVLEDRLTDTRIIEEGLCGRTTDIEDELRPGRRAIDVLPVIMESHSPLDAAIIMLGTNDCKSAYGSTISSIGRGISACLDIILDYLPSHSILLISPMLLGDDVWLPEKDPEFSAESVSLSHGLKPAYRNIAANKKTAFMAASDYITPDAADDEHMNESGHAAFADAVFNALGGMELA